MGHGLYGDPYWPPPDFGRPMSEPVAKTGKVSEIVMPEAEGFVLAAVNELQRRVDAGHLALPAWEVDGPRKLPSDPKSGSAALYTTTVGDVEVELRRYWPQEPGQTIDESDWIYGITMSRHGLVLGWMMTDAPDHPVGALVERVSKMHQAELKRARGAGLGDLSL